MIVLVACVLLGGCVRGGQQATSNPTSAVVPTAPPAAPAAVPQPTLVASPLPAAAAIEPFPLQAGWWDTAVCYEVFVRSFYDSDGDGIGDLNGLIEKLDYINDGNPAAQQDLGANCIWLMPIMEAKSYHGYDTLDYYSVEQDYGSNDDFKRLIDEAHKRGIKVMIDLVLNHTSSDHPWFQEALRDPASPYREYFIWSPQDPGYRGPWGAVAWHKSPAAAEYFYGLFWDGMPDLNYRNPAVTAEAQKISSFWRNEMGADGFRLDAIKHLIEDGTKQEHTPETLAWLRGYRAFLDRAAPGTFTVGEIFDATPTILQPYYPDQLDSYFVFDLGGRIIAAAAQSNGRPFASAAQRVEDGIPFQRYAPFLTNHDQNRAMNFLGGDVSKAKIAATALLTLPGMPFVYYGEEIGMLGEKGSPPKVDEPLRTPMQWSAEAGGGFSGGQPWQALQPNYSEVNVAAQASDADSLLNLYRKLIHLHTTTPALAQGSLTRLESSENAVAAYLRQHGDQAVLVVLNFGKEQVDGATLDLEASALAPGAYELAPLLGDQPGAQLAVGMGGSVSGYTPLPELAPRTGYIFELRP
ncbi:MAG: DUF3459 domain-containing protein [Roseiflexaceae bacterium]|nr:DUF3459 domain-containing protein [Roseiflexaceae bacterium]